MQHKVGISVDMKNEKNCRNAGNEYSILVEL